MRSQTKKDPFLQKDSRDLTLTGTALSKADHFLMVCKIERQSE
jgi:hypothetical protein